MRTLILSSFILVNFHNFLTVWRLPPAILIPCSLIQDLSHCLLIHSIIDIRHLLLSKLSQDILQVSLSTLVDGATSSVLMTPYFPEMNRQFKCPAH